MLTKMLLKFQIVIDINEIIRHHLSTLVDFMKPVILPKVRTEAVKKSFMLQGTACNNEVPADTRNLNS